MVRVCVLGLNRKRERKEISRERERDGIQVELQAIDRTEMDIEVLKSGDIALLLVKALEDVDLGGDKFSLGLTLGEALEHVEDLDTNEPSVSIT